MATVTIPELHRPPDRQNDAANLDEVLAAMRSRGGRPPHVPRGRDLVQLPNDIELGLLRQGIRQESPIDTIVEHIPDGPDPDAMGSNDAVATALVLMRRAPEGWRLAFVDQVDRPASGMGSTAWLAPAAAAQSRTFQDGGARMSL
ncbi:MAG: hypothetical protein ACU0BO_11070 [Limimaricola soesokkakensis]|uniref:hypothetical protein n=1 Tax=Limimaricola soesokkakensis TaxID=1343159 RepID=UPI0040585924